MKDEEISTICAGRAHCGKTDPSGEKCPAFLECFPEHAIIKYNRVK